MPIDRNAKDTGRLLRNQQRTRNGAVSSDIKVAAPLANSGGKVQILLLTNGGLTISGGQLAAALNATNPALALTGGLAVTLSGGTLAKDASGLKLNFPTTKGDLVGFDTAPARVPVGADGQVVMADSTAALGLKWAAVSRGWWKTTNSSIDITNRVDEYSLVDYCTFGANFLTAGQRIRWHSCGAFQAAAGSTVTVRVKLGGTTLATYVATPPASSSPFVIDANVVPLAVGAAAGTRADLALLPGGVAVGTGNIDTTASADLRISVQWSAADINNHMTFYSQHVSLE